MWQGRGWKPHVLFLIVPMLLVLLASAQAQPAAGKAKADRLVMGLIEKYRDYWRPWINGTPDHMIQHDPAFEWLFTVRTSAWTYFFTTQVPPTCRYLVRPSGTKKGKWGTRRSRPALVRISFRSGSSIG